MIEQIMEIDGRTTAIEEALRNIVRVGEVVGRDAASVRCRVQFKDNDSLVSYWCQVIAVRTGPDKLYWLPDIGEMVICLFLTFGQEQGFIVGSAYNSQDSRPSEAEDEDMYIDNHGRVVITAADDIVIKSDKSITLRAPQVIIDGELYPRD